MVLPGCEELERVEVIAFPFPARLLFEPTVTQYSGSKAAIFFIEAYNASLPESALESRLECLFLRQKCKMMEHCSRGLVFVAISCAIPGWQLADENFADDSGNFAELENRISCSVFHRFIPV